MHHAIALTATSIVAAPEPNGVAVFALTNTESFIYEDQYAPTGDPANPYAWTGWKQVGNMVATAIAATSTSDPSSANEPTLFAVGVNSVISVSQAFLRASVLGSSELAFSDFTPLSGLDATALSVQAVGAQILVAGLTGPQSFAYGNLYNASIDPVTTPGTAAGWTVASDYVFSKITASTSPSGAPVIAGFSPYGYQAVTLSINLADAP